MKKILTALLCFMFIFSSMPATFAVQNTQPKKIIKYNQNAKTIKYAFVFDGPSDKNQVVMKQFQQAITATTAPEFKAVFDANKVFTGNWTKESVANVSNKALASDATMVVSLGYLSTKYLSEKKDKKKFVVTIDQYGLRDFGEGFFNPIHQSVKGIVNFKTLVNFKKVAILMNENYYKLHKNWNEIVGKKLEGIDFVILPATTNIEKTIASIPNDCDAVALTPLFNLTVEQRQNLINKLTSKRLPTYSTLGKEDVEMGILMGTGAYDLDRKIAEATSFDIKGVLSGNSKLKGQLNFYEDEIIYFNQDTADALNFQAHLRVLNNAEIISNKKPVVYDLTTIFNTFEERNLDIVRKKALVKAARRSSVAAVLKYLPSLVVNLQFQDYNSKFAESANLSIPDQQSAFQIGIEQVLYSPALVTNIILKKKNLDFSKEEARLTEQNVAIDLALLYVETLILKNRIEIQKEYVKQSRENLAIARVREKMGKCGKEEILRWAAQLNINEQHLLSMTADLNNLKIDINKLLHKEQTEKFDLAPLTAKDPAFYTRDLHVIDYVTTPEALESFTQLLTGYAYQESPELAKLRCAIKMKNAERAMYYQKFILPDAKLSLYHTTLFNRKYTGDVVIPAADMRQPVKTMGPYMLGTPVTLPRSELNNLQLTIAAQWKPIEGGTKIAEIARINAEIEELKRYEDEVKITLEQHVRTVINKALSAYFSIEKDYKAMYAAGENYKDVKIAYYQGDASVVQLLDAQKTYLDSKTNALNAQYVFFKELLWVQRSLCSVNWTKATPEARQFIEDVKSKLIKRSDIKLL